jgi:acetylglutamate kinase
MIAPDGQGALEFRKAFRVTDEETRKSSHGAGRQDQRDLVATINREALDEPVAVGVSGEDAGLLTVTPREAALGFVGDVSHVRASVLHRLLDEGLAPVVSTIGADETGQPFNINATRRRGRSRRRWAPRRSSISPPRPACSRMSTIQARWCRG